MLWSDCSEKAIPQNMVYATEWSNHCAYNVNLPAITVQFNTFNANVMPISSLDIHILLFFRLFLWNHFHNFIHFFFLHLHWIIINFMKGKKIRDTSCAVLPLQIFWCKPPQINAVTRQILPIRTQKKIIQSYRYYKYTWSAIVYKQSYHRFTSIKSTFSATTRI